MTKGELKSRIDALCYPALICTSSGRILARNRFAKALLPEKEKVIAALGRTRKEPLEAVTLGGVRYFVSEKTWEDGLRTVCFFETFAPFCEDFARLVLEELEERFWQDYSALPDDAAKGTSFSRILARSVRLRSNASSLLQLLRLKDVPQGETVSCSLTGFFRHLSEALAQTGVRVQCTEEKENAVLVPPSSLILLVLSLARYAYLVSGTGQVSAEIRCSGRRTNLRLSLTDEGETLSLLEDILYGEGTPSPRTLFLLPLAITLSLCEKQGIPWRLLKQDERIVFSVTLERAVTPPTAFLSAKEGEEVSELWNRVREFFS